MKNCNIKSSIRGTRNQGMKLSILLLAMVLCTFGQNMYAATFTFIGNGGAQGSNHWSNTALWQSAHYPGSTVVSGDTVNLNSGDGANDISVDVNLTFNSGAVINVATGIFIIGVNGQTITNSGIINGTNGNLAIDDRLTAFTNNGTVVMNIYMGSGYTFTNNATGTYTDNSGNGFWFEGGTIINYGIVNLNAYNTSALSFQNESTGILNINNGGHLFNEVYSPNTGAISNTGTINVKSGGKLDLFQGGTFTQSGGGATHILSGGILSLEANVAMNLFDVQSGATVEAGFSPTLTGPFTTNANTTFWVGEGAAQNN
jgi:hypothetical protein